MSKSQRLRARSLGCEPSGHTRVAQDAARLAVVWKGRAELPLRARFFSGGLMRPVRRWPRAATLVEALGPTLVRPLTRASRQTRLRGGLTRPCLLPHCDASRARPSSGSDYE